MIPIAIKSKEKNMNPNGIQQTNLKNEVQLSRVLLAARQKITMPHTDIPANPEIPARMGSIDAAPSLMPSTDTKLLSHECVAKQTATTMAVRAIACMTSLSSSPKLYHFSENCFILVPFLFWEKRRMKGASRLLATFFRPSRTIDYSIIIAHLV